MTNLPQVQGNFQTMSSREIATLCEKEHRHVLRDIDNLNETYEKMGLPKVGQGYDQAVFTHTGENQGYPHEPNPLYQS